jgi:hypothetical protein
MKTETNDKLSYIEAIIRIRYEKKDEGKLEILTSLVSDGLLSLDEAVKRSELTEREFLEKMKEISEQK